MSEKVLCVPASVFEKLGPFRGFTRNWTAYSILINMPSLQSFIPRSIAEHDETQLQLIPYVLFVHRPTGKVFSYLRSKMQGERRLHGKRSIGVGGHINDGDVGASCHYRRGLKREVREEVDFNGDVDDLRLYGMLHDPSNDVGRVHLGIVHVATVEDETDVRPREESMLDAGFFSLDWLAERGDDLETWSQLCVAELQREASE